MVRRIDGGRTPTTPARGLRPAAGHLAAAVIESAGRAVHRRGREGDPPGGRGGLSAAVVPAGRALAGRAGGRAGPLAGGRRSTWSARQLAEEVTGFHVHRGALASLHREQRHTVDRSAAGRRRLVIMEDIVDHTNVGAILRNAAALGWDGALLSPRAADPLYRRAIKVSMGAVFSLPWARLSDWAGAPARLADAGFITVALTLAPDAVDLDSVASDLRADQPVAIMVGTEGAGLSRAVDRRARRPGQDPDERRHRLAERRGRARRSPATPSRVRGAHRPVGGVVVGQLLVQGYSFLRARPESRSPNTVPFRWSVSCCRQRASSPVPITSTGSPRGPGRGRSRGRAGPAPGRRRAATGSPRRRSPACGPCPRAG